MIQRIILFLEFHNSMPKAQSKNLARLLQQLLRFITQLHAENTILTHFLKPQILNGEGTSTFDSDMKYVLAIPTTCSVKIDFSHINTEGSSKWNIWQVESANIKRRSGRAHRVLK